MRRVPSTPAPESPDLDAELDEAGEREWRTLASFGAGLTIGALLGAGAALLLAPASGFETRMRLAKGARRAGERAADRWEAVGDRVQDVARRSRRSLRRKITLGRWRAEDAWERRRHPRHPDDSRLD